jgi:hypothetical protein
MPGKARRIVALSEDNARLQEQVARLTRVRDAAAALLAWHEGPDMREIDGIVQLHQVRGYSVGFQHCGAQLAALRAALAEDDDNA